MKPPYSAIRHLGWICFDSYIASQRGLVAMLTAYFDESRTEAQQPYPVVAGFIGTVARWRKFEKAWTVVLRDAGVSAFHANRWFHGNGEFAGWSLVQKEQLVKRLLPLITRFASTRVAASIQRADYDAACARTTPTSDGLASQYELCGISCLVMCAHFAKRHDYRDQIPTVFDEGNRYRHQFEQAHRQVRKVYPDVVAEYFVGSLTFGSDTLYPPLQAADLFAWALSRVFYDRLVKQVESPPLAHLVVDTIWRHFKHDGLDHFIKGSVIEQVLKAGRL